MRCLNDTGNRPQLWSSHLRVTRREATGLRGMFLGIYGGIGQHRYPQVGSGDTNESWGTLAYEIYLTITSANVGVGWTHDLGGFYDKNTGDGGKRDPEIFLRWLQYGALSHLYRTHCSHCEIRIWKYPNFDSLQKAFHLRNNLFPYIYTASRNTYDTGILVVHPIYYEWSTLNITYKYASSHYMFGDSFMVAPITSAVDPITKLAKKKIYGYLQEDGLCGKQEMNLWDLKKS